MDETEGHTIEPEGLTIKEKFKNLMIKLKESQDVLGDLNEVFKEKHKIFEVENETLLNDIKSVKEGMETMEIIAKGVAEKIFEETKEKNIGFGVTVKSFALYDYDKNEAFEWAKKHQLALKLDDTAFKKIMKSDPKNMKFVIVDSEDRATLPKVYKEV